MRSLWWRKKHHRPSPDGKNSPLDSPLKCNTRATYCNKYLLPWLAQFLPGMQPARPACPPSCIAPRAAGWFSGRGRPSSPVYSDGAAARGSVAENTATRIVYRGWSSKPLGHKHTPLNGLRNGPSLGPHARSPVRPLARHVFSAKTGVCMQPTTRCKK